MVVMQIYCVLYLEIVTSLGFADLYGEKKTSDKLGVHIFILTMDSLL